MVDSFPREIGEGSATATASWGPWECCAQAPGAVIHPDQLTQADGEWMSTTVPSTVANTLRTTGRWDMQRPENIDGQDWWYRSTFEVSVDSIGQPCTLCFDGLATLADIWLNGEHLLSTDNMFRVYQLDVTSQIRDENELAIRFRSLAADLQQKRPRPRWKTNLVDHQQLRWQRTTLLGHTPGWSPPVPAIGPWRDIRLECQPVRLADVQLLSRLEGTTGVVTFRARVHSSAPINRVSLRVGDHEVSVTVHADSEGTTLSGELRFPNPPLWWPHTHGDQPLFACDLLVDAGSDRHVLGCGSCLAAPSLRAIRL